MIIFVYPPSRYDIKLILLAVEIFSLFVYFRLQCFHILLLQHFVEGSKCSVNVQYLCSYSVLHLYIFSAFSKYTINIDNALKLSIAPAAHTNFSINDNFLILWTSYSWLVWERKQLQPREVNTVISPRFMRMLWATYKIYSTVWRKSAYHI